MASALAHIELVLLFWLTLTLALLPMPVPRAWALVSGGLLAIETAAVRGIRHQACGEECGIEERDRLVGSLAEAVGALVVPALTAVLLCVVFFHLARAHAAARRRLRAALAARP